MPISRMFRDVFAKIPHFEAKEVAVPFSRPLSHYLRFVRELQQLLCTVHNLYFDGIRRQHEDEKRRVIQLLAFPNSAEFKKLIAVGPASGDNLNANSLD
jgi:hypothetical protein